MLAQLLDGRAIELSGTDRNICFADDFKGSLAGLYRRGLVNTKMVVLNGKEVQSVFITREGIDFLNKYEQDKKKLKSLNEQGTGERSEYNTDFIFQSDPLWQFVSRNNERRSNINSRL